MTITGPTTLSASMESGTTVPPKTFTGPATITISTSTYTTTAAATKKSGASSQSLETASRLLEKVIISMFGFCLIAAVAL
jgi:hypothetical protein